MPANAVLRIALLAILLLAACRCDDDAPPPPRSAETRRGPSGEEIVAKLPKVEGTPIEPNTLATGLPATLGDAAAEGDAKAEGMPLAGDGLLSSASRVYVKDGVRVTIQLTDTLHAPLLRAAVAGARAKADKEKTPSWRGGAVQGRDAVVQYVASQSVAIANVIVTDRLFLNVRVEPADNAEAAIEWAQKLPLDAITKLQPVDSKPAAPSQPPPL